MQIFSRAYARRGLNGVRGNENAKPILAMIYNEATARYAARLWKVPTSTLARWRRKGIIPDHRVLHQPLDKAGQDIETRLILLIEAGWLKARPISRWIGTEDKVNALLAARRHPKDERYHVKHLHGDELVRVKSLLDRLYQLVTYVLFLAGQEVESPVYSDVLQAKLRALLAREEIDTVTSGQAWIVVR